MFFRLKPFLWIYLKGGATRSKGELRNSLMCLETSFPVCHHGFRLDAIRARVVSVYLTTFTMLAPQVRARFIHPAPLPVGFCANVSGRAVTHGQELQPQANYMGHQYGVLGSSISLPFK